MFDIQNRYKKLSLSEKIVFHKEKLQNLSKGINNIIYAQASTVCIRNIKHRQLV